MIGDVIVLSTEPRGETVSGGPAFPKRLVDGGLLKGGNRMPPSGATVGENKAPLEDVCKCRNVRIWWSDGVEGTALGLSWTGWVEEIASGVVIVSPS